MWCLHQLILLTYFRFSTPCTRSLALDRHPHPVTTSAAHHKSLTTNSINFSRLEYLWMPVVPQSAVFCLDLNTWHKFLWSSSSPVTALMVKRAHEYRRGGLLSLGHKQNGPLWYNRRNISEFIQIPNMSINQSLQLPAAQIPMAHATQATSTLIPLHIKTTFKNKNCLTAFASVNGKQITSKSSKSCIVVKITGQLIGKCSALHEMCLSVQILFSLDLQGKCYVAHVGC